MEQKTKKPTNTTSAADKKLAAMEKKYQQEMEAMRKQLEELSKSLTKTVKEPETSNDKKLDLDEDVDVISLCNHKLNLATGGFGRGEIYSFEEFGGVSPIPYRDLKEIVKNNKSFLEKGYFYVDNVEARKALRINKLYEKLPKAEDLITLLSKDAKEVEKQLKIATKEQITIIASIVIDKLFTNEKIDMNIVKVVGDAVGRDLVTIANDKKEILSGQGDE